jgi:phage baseplate assembly protein W
MAQDVHNITAADWQPALNSLGDIVQNYDDVDQCIQIILTTPKGSVAHRPDFGSNLWLYLDNPLPQSIPHIIRESVDALSRWEPRIELLGFVPSIIPPSQVMLQVQWRVTGQALQRFTEVILAS